MQAHEVVVAGGGPTGMVLAAELALAGVDAVVVEQRPDARLVGSRAGGLNARTLELFDQRGIADRFLDRGRKMPGALFGTAMLDISDFPSRHPYFLAIFQNEIEQILDGWCAEVGVRFRRGCAVRGFTQDDGGVDVRLADGSSIRARWLVGCDGGRSLVRKTAGIGFPGAAATKSALIAEVELTEAPPAGPVYTDAGIHGVHPLADGRTFRIVTTEDELGTGEPTLADLMRNLTGAFGTDLGAHSPVWLSRFTDATRQAASYRAGRVLLAGDAAHVHWPAGGQGLSLGVQDAMNLGWKLAQVAHGTAPDTLLDTYAAERRPEAARVLEHTMALSALQPRDERTRALVALASDLAALDEPRKRIGGLRSGLDVHYDLGDGHPLLGRRMPDLDLGDTRVYELLRDARPLCLDVSGTEPSQWELPVLGPVPPPTAVEVRPDGYVAWVAA